MISLTLRTMAPNSFAILDQLSNLAFLVPMFFGLSVELSVCVLSIQLLICLCSHEDSHQCFYPTKRGEPTRKGFDQERQGEENLTVLFTLLSYINQQTIFFQDGDLSKYIPGKVKVSAPNLSKLKKK